MLGLLPASTPVSSKAVKVHSNNFSLFPPHSPHQNRQNNCQFCTWGYVSHRLSKRYRLAENDSFVIVAEWRLPQDPLDITAFRGCCFKYGLASRSFPKIEANDRGVDFELQKNNERGESNYQILCKKCKYALKLVFKLSSNNILNRKARKKLKEYFRSNL